MRERWFPEIRNNSWIEVTEHFTHRYYHSVIQAQIQRSFTWEPSLKSLRIRKESISFSAYNMLCIYLLFNSYNKTLFLPLKLPVKKLRLRLGKFFFPFIELVSIGVELATSDDKLIVLLVYKGERRENASHSLIFLSEDNCLGELSSLKTLFWEFVRHTRWIDYCCIELAAKHLLLTNRTDSSRISCGLWKPSKLTIQWSQLLWMNVMLWHCLLGSFFTVILFLNL